MSRAKDEIENQEAEVQIPQEVAVLPSGETVIYPEMVIPLAAGEEKMVKLIDDVLSGDKNIRALCPALRWRGNERR